jgi:MFS-type transporter involved in bile tolerance (Atg22 family)
LAGVIILMVILFVAYFCGGYVAGRMARFNGVKQGVAVWAWGIVIAVVLAVIGAIAGSQLNINAPSYPETTLRRPSFQQ